MAEYISIERERLLKMLDKTIATKDEDTNDYIEWLADELLTGIIVPPVKVGDTVWVKEMRSGKIKECKIARIRASVSEKARTYAMVAEKLRRPITISFMFTEKDIGHEVFLTKKEAKEAKNG